MKDKKCLLCGKEGEGISQTTMLHHLHREHHRKLMEGIQYYYCPNPRCEMVYFGGGRTYFTKDVKTRVTLKDYDRSTPLCHCIQVTKGQVLDEISATGSTMILEKIKKGALEGKKNCEATNPRGKDCFLEVLRWLENKGAALDLKQEKTVYLAGLQSKSESQP